MKSKKSARRGAAYMVAEECFLVNNAGLVKLVLEGGWEKVHGMHISIYGHKTRTVESLQRCFMTLHWMKCPSVNELRKMTKDGRHAKWHNGVQNHQNVKPLPVLDPQIKGYNPA
eukprot:9802725-Ditylum_brightwellii.AAC.1